jgi:hypothetical protein
MAKAKPQHAPEQTTNKHDADLRSALDTFPSRREVAKFLITQKRAELWDILEKGKTTKKLTNEQKGNLHEVLQHIATAQLDDEQTLTMLQEHLSSLSSATTSKQILSLAQKLEALKQGSIPTDTGISRLQELLQDPEFIAHYQKSHQEYAEGIKHLSHGAELYRAPRIDLQALTVWHLTTKAPRSKQGTTLPLKHITDTERLASIEKLSPKQNLFSPQDLAYLWLTKSTISLATLDAKIQQIQSYLDALQLHMYTSWQLTSDYPVAINAEIQTLRTLITKIEITKQLHLDTHEVVAYERRHRLQWLKKELDETWLASTETVTKQYEEMRQHIFAGRSVLLTGPVGTWKTVGARKLVAELIETKLTRLKKQLKDLPPTQSSTDSSPFEKGGGEWNEPGDLPLTPQQILEKEIETLTKLLTDPPFINGNAETTVRQFESVVSQVKTWNGHLLEYLPGPLTQCMKYGLPLIIDEANRLSPDVLSALKGELAKRAGTSFTDKKTGESFIIQKFSIILTANEDHHHDTTKKFQDQIEREFRRVTIGYLPPAEYAQIISAKTMGSLGVYTDIWPEAWTAHIDATDASKTGGGILPRLLEAQQLIIASYAKNGTKYDITLWSTASKQQISSAIWDTKRFLELRNTWPDDRHDRIKYPTLTDYIKAKVIAFIKSQISDKDQMVLCVIFNKLGILDANDTPALADRNVCVHLKASDFTPNLSLTLRDAPGSNGLTLTTPYQRATVDQYGDSYPDMPFDNPHIAYAQLASELMTQVQNNSTKTLLRQITKDGSLRSEKLPKLVEALCTEGTDAYLGLYRHLEQTPGALEKFSTEQEKLQQQFYIYEAKRDILEILMQNTPTQQDTDDIWLHALRDLLYILTIDNRELHTVTELTDRLEKLDENSFISVMTHLSPEQLACLADHQRLQARYDTIDLARRKVAEDVVKQKIKHSSWVSPFSDLPPWPALDHILEFRRNFRSQVKSVSGRSDPQENNNKTIPELITIAEAIIKKWWYRPCTHAGLTVHQFDIPWWQWAFADSNSTFTDQQAKADPDVFNHYEYNNKILSKGKKPLIYKKALWSSNDIMTWAEPVKASMQSLEKEWITFDATGDLRWRANAMKKQYPSMTDCDVLTIYMYCTAQYGWFWTWQIDANGNRGFLCLDADLRGFGSDDHDDILCSLLFAVPGDSQVVFPPTPVEVQSNHTWWNDSVTGIGTKLLDTKTSWILVKKKKTLDFTDEASCKTELIQRMDAWASQHIKHISNPRGLGGFATQIQHKDFNGGRPRNYYEPTISDFNRITWNTATSNLYIEQYNYANQTKLWVKLRSIRGDLSLPHQLPDMIQEDPSNPSSKKEKNLTKTYLLELKNKIPSYNAQTEAELIKLMEILWNDLWLPPESWKDQPLRKAALMYLASLSGRYRTWQYSDDSRGYVSLYVDLRWFDSYGRDISSCSLLFARDSA